jgi:hypothetical protein
MIKVANLTIRNLNDSIGFYKERGMELDPRPRLPIQYSDPLVRLDFSQKQIRTFVQDLLVSLKKQNFEGVLLAALPDISAYVVQQASVVGLSVFMPLLSHDKRLLGIAEIITE